MDEPMCSGRTAVVTGAAGKGMGRSVALTLAREGANVVVNYRRSRRDALQVADAIHSQGAQAVAVRGDVFTAKGCQAVVESALNEFGQIDICVVNPGGEWRQGPIDKIDPGDALEDVRRELAPLFHLLPLVLPGMLERRWGRLIGLGLLPEPNVTAGHGYSYCVGKAARTEAMRLLEHQASQKGVTVNMMAPGPVSAIEAFDEAVAQCAHGQPWHDRPNVSPQDIAEGVALLCSEAGRFITGAVIPYRAHH